MVNYNFPCIEHIDQVEHLIKHRSDFVLTERDGYSIVQYIYITSDTFPPIEEKTALSSAILRECRGITFDAQGQVISRPFHKFFNINEREETLLQNIDLSKGYEVLEKLDGAMIRPIPLNGEYRLATKLGVSQQSLEVEEFVASRPEYDKLIRQAIALDSTPIFEWCSPKLESVVQYHKERLTLLAIRHNWTGQYLPLAEIEDWVRAISSGIPVVKSLKISLEQVLDMAKTATGEEGWVIRFPDGHAVKLKSSWYLRLHRLKDDFETEKFILDQLINGKTDDLYSFLNDAHQKRLQAFESQFWQAINAQAQRFEEQFDEYQRQGDQKWFALNIAPSLTGVERHIFWKLWKKANARQTVIEAIANNLGNSTRIDSVRFLWGSHRWNQN